MTRRQVASPSRPLFRCILLVIVLFGAVSCASAQMRTLDIPTGKAIRIKMKGSNTVSSPYQIDKVLPNAKALCNSNFQDDCFDSVEWELKGPDLPEGFTVEIRLKAGVDADCFAESKFVLKDNGPVSSGKFDYAKCPKWTVWPYDVVLLEGGKDKQTLDPLLVVNH